MYFNTCIALLSKGQVNELMDEIGFLRTNRSIKMDEKRLLSIDSSA